MTEAVVEGWLHYFSVNLTCSLVVLAFFLLVWYRCGYRPYQYFKNLGIPGPKPLPFIGNLHQAGSELYDFKELCKKYGEVCGFYVGHTPVLVVGNPEMVKEITIKQAANFMDRSACSGLFCSIQDGKKYESIFSQRGEEWKKSRQLISPAFSTHKLKLLEPQVQESIKCFTQRLAEAKGGSVETLRLYRELTTEVTLSTVLGQQVKVQQGEGTELYSHLSVVLNLLQQARGHFSFIITIGAAMSWLAEYILLPLLKNQYTVAGRSSNAVMKSIRQLITDKMVGSEGKQIQNKSILEQMAEASRAAKLDSFQDGHVADNANALVLAGHDTTSIAVACASYLLALHPEVQERLAEEIDNYRQENPDESLYDVAQNLEYLDMVWQESLRMYSPAGMLNRRCSKDTVVNGIPIKEGCLIAIPLYYLHFKEDCWTDPERFNPDRFSKSQKSSIHPGAFIPFGSGPRTCIGMRLANMEAMMALIEVLSKFRIVRAPETKVPLVLDPGASMVCNDAIYLRFEERQ